MEKLPLGSVFATAMGPSELASGSTMICTLLSSRPVAESVAIPDSAHLSAGLSCATKRNANINGSIMTLFGLGDVHFDSLMTLSVKLHGFAARFDVAEEIGVEPCAGFDVVPGEDFVIAGRDVLEFVAAVLIG